jgi:hypothetical protein
MIPKLLHRWWNDPRNPPPHDFAAELRDLHRGWKLVDHPPGLWADWLDQQPGARPCDQARHRSNLLRYRILLEHGGVWVDWDIEPVRPLDPFLDAPRLASAGPSHPEGGVMIFPPGHPFLAELLATVPRSRPVGSAVEVSGAAHLKRTLRRHPGVVLERRLYGRDAHGQRTYMGTPYVRHHWATSRGR